jgi:protein involved in polysaccharide export with SLBB domain
VLGVFCLSGCVSQPVLPEAQQALVEPEEYRLGVGEIISIRVYGGEEELTFPRIRLNDRAVLALPFGDFPTFGHTTRELETAITNKLKGQYLLRPRVWVNIEEYRPFFMQGQVMRPGGYPYQPGLSVLRAITIAGGFRERASQRKIFVVRENDKTNTPVKVDLKSAVRPGDTVIVEESFF